MYYCFLSSSEDVEHDPKVLIVHDDRLGAIWAFCVKAKGPSPEVVTWVTNKLEEAGSRRIHNGPEAGRSSQTTHSHLDDRVHGACVLSQILRRKELSERGEGSSAR